MTNSCGGENLIPIFFPEFAVVNRKRVLFLLIKRTIIEMNLFKSIPPSQDKTIIRQQRHATRVFLIVLSASLSILTLFTFIRIQTTTVNIVEPTSKEFLQLYNQYSSTLNCPCSQAAIRYDQLILSIQPEYHQICSSEFVSTKWINLDFIRSPSTYIATHDFRSQSEIHFQLLSTLCHVASRTVEDHLGSFYQTRFVSPEVLNRESFRIQTNAIMEQFQRTVPESFQHTLELIIANLEVNQPIVPTNTFFFLPFGSGDNIQRSDIGFQSERPGCSSPTLDCICRYLSAKVCYRFTRIMDADVNQIIPGMFFTWFPLQSLLMSTLECLYNDSCLSQIQAFINRTTSLTNFTALQLSAGSYTNDPSEQVEALANRLFIQSWKNESSYQSYFDHCHPLTCRYIYQSRFALLYIITTVIGLVGGLLIVSRLLAPVIVTVLYILWNYIRRRQQNGTVVALQTAPDRSGNKMNSMSLISYSSVSSTSERKEAEREQNDHLQSISYQV